MSSCWWKEVWEDVVVQTWAYNVQFIVQIDDVCCVVRYDQSLTTAGTLPLIKAIPSTFKLDIQDMTLQVNKSNQ